MVWQNRYVTGERKNAWSTKSFNKNDVPTQNMKRSHDEFQEITFYPQDFADLEPNRDDEDEPRSKRKRRGKKNNNHTNDNNGRKKSVLQIRDESKVSQIGCLPVDVDEEGNPTPFVEPELWKSNPPTTPQEYLLRVRYEAQNMCQQTVVAENIDPRAYDERVTKRIPEVFNQFEEYTQVQDETENIVDVHAPTEWVTQCIRTFTHMRNKVLRDRGYMDEDGMDEATKIVFDQIPHNTDWSEWKLYCFGGKRRTKKLEQENPPAPQQQTEEITVAQTSNETAQTTTDDAKDAEAIVFEKEESDVMDETETIKEDAVTEIEEPQEPKEMTEIEPTEEKAETTEVTIVESHEPTERVLYCLDYVTTVGLLHRLVQWTTDENVLSRIRFLWIYSVLLILDNPAPPNSAANLTALLRWLLEQRSKIAKGANRDNLPHLNTLITIIVMFFQQGEKAVV